MGQPVTGICQQVSNRWKEKISKKEFLGSWAKRRGSTMVLMRFPFLALFCALLSPGAIAQTSTDDGSPNSFGEAIGRQATLDFSFEPDTNLDAGGAYSYWDVRLSAPVFGKKLSDDWLVGLRLRYRASELDWTGQSLFDNDLLHRLELNLALVYKPTSSPWVGFLSAGPALATDGSNINSDDIFYVAIIGIGYRFSESFTLLGGAYFSQDFGESRLLPAPGFIWTPSDKWTLSLIPPRLRIAYSPNENWRIAAEAFPDGGSWSITTQEGQSAFLDRSGVRMGLRVERRVSGNGWLYLGGGWMVGRELVVEDTKGQRLFESDADSGAYINTGFAWRF